MNIRTIVALGLLPVLTATGCAATRPVLKNITPRVVGADVRGVDMAFDLDIENQLPFPIKSTRGRYALDVAGSGLLSSDEVPALNLPAGSTGKVTLPARVEFAEMIKTAGVLAKEKEVPYQFDGALLFGLMGSDYELPFSHEGMMPGPAEAVKRGAEGLLNLP